MQFLNSSQSCCGCCILIRVCQSFSTSGQNWLCTFWAILLHHWSPKFKNWLIFSYIIVMSLYHCELGWVISFFIQLVLSALSKWWILIIFRPPCIWLKAVVDLLILSGFPFHKNLYKMVFNVLRNYFDLGREDNKWTHCDIRLILMTVILPRGVKYLLCHVFTSF